MAFDASYYGESGGYPRRIESPEVRVEDFSAAVDFLSNHPAVDADRIGVVGIWLGIVCDQIVRVCLTNWRFKSGKWTKIKI